MIKDDNCVGSMCWPTVNGSIHWFAIYIGDESSIISLFDLTGMDGRHHFCLLSFPCAFDIFAVTF